MQNSFFSKILLLNCCYLLTTLCSTMLAPQNMCNVVHMYYYAPAPRVGGIKRWCASDVCLSDVWCLSVAYIGPKSRIERFRKTKIGTEVAHVARDSVTTFKVKRSKVNLQGAGAYCGGLPHSLFFILFPTKLIVIEVHGCNNCNNIFANAMAWLAPKTRPFSYILLLSRPI